MVLYNGHVPCIFMKKLLFTEYIGHNLIEDIERRPNVEP